MTRIVAVVALIQMTAFHCAQAAAATLAFQQVDSAVAVYLNGQELNGHFDTVDVIIEPISPTIFTNASTGLAGGEYLPPGRPFTYINRLLNTDPGDDPRGQGWSTLGVVNTPTRVAFAGSPLGQKIDTSSQPGGNLFLANVNLSPPLPQGNFRARVLLISAGILVADLTVVPEPAGVALGLTSILGLAILRRNRSHRKQCVDCRSPGATAGLPSSAR
jgi:hypothetical protein